MLTKTSMKLDARLVKQARTAGCVSGYSADAQLEFWAKLGKVAEEVLSGRSIKRLKSSTWR